MIQEITDRDRVADKRDPKNSLRDFLQVMEEQDNGVVNPPFLTEAELEQRLARNPLDLIIYSHLDSLPRCP